MIKYIKYCFLGTLVLFFKISMLAQIPVLFTDTNWKVLRSATAPSGWTSFIFDETGWSNAIQVSQATCLTPHNQTPAQSCNVTAMPIWASRPNNDCSIEGDIVFFRRKFTVPFIECAEVPGYYPNYTLTVKADNSSEIYINSNFLGSTNNNWQTGTTFSIPLSFLKLGSGGFKFQMQQNLEFSHRLR
jgi:hypothetical protein